MSALPSTSAKRPDAPTATNGASMGMGSASGDTHGTGDGGMNGTTKKRRKGATRLSCAECRRLKLRCDRNVPCGSCVKRGCGAICPDGSLTTGQGNRFVLATTQDLHEHIATLSSRVRSLEDALRESHSRLAPDEQHPLLTEELLRLKAPLQREPAGGSPTGARKDGSPGEEGGEVVDAFGSLSIDVAGRATFFGTTANSWYFLQNEVAEDGDSPESPESEEDLSAVLPDDVLARSAQFPLSLNTAVSANGTPDLSREGALVWFLPPIERAMRLRDVYYENASWMYSPISRISFDTHIFTPIFSSASAAALTTPSPISAGSRSDGEAAADPARLALLFIVLAIGALMDTQERAYGREAARYFALARAALARGRGWDEPGVWGVQALFLMSFYLFFSDRHGSSSGTRWVIMGMAVKVAQSIGLHRDSGRWKVDEEETQRRRELFWELYVYDSWQSLTFGRPPSFALAHIDCKMPYPPEPEDTLYAFNAWKHRFCSEVIAACHDQAFGARAPTYATVLALDRRTRAFAVPSVLQVAGFGTNPGSGDGTWHEGVGLTLQRHIVLAMREMVLLYLHRSFFARAISDHPRDPLGSPYGTSVIAAYRSSGSLVALMRNLHAQLREPSERIWFLWGHMFSCVIVLGSIVTRCPSLSLAPSAVVQLDSACELFAKVAGGFRAEKVLSIMLRLQEKAHASLSEFRAGKSPQASRGPSSMVTDSPKTENDEEDELTRLGGKTRLVAKGATSGSTSSNPGSPQQLASSPQNIGITSSPTTHAPVVPLPPLTGANVHPNVVEYLRTFGPRSTIEHGLGGGVSFEQQHSLSISTSYGQQQQRQQPPPPNPTPSTPYGPTVFDQQPQTHPSQQRSTSFDQMYQQQQQPRQSSFDAGHLPPLQQSHHRGYDETDFSSSSEPAYQDMNYEPTAFHQESPPPQQQHISPVSQQPQYSYTSQQQQNDNARRGSMMSGMEPFPQYFSVYDYGQGASGSMGTNAGMYMGGQRRDSTPPEMNSMHNTWQDYVAGLGL